MTPLSDAGHIRVNERFPQVLKRRLTCSDARQMRRMRGESSGLTAPAGTRNVLSCQQEERRRRGSRASHWEANGTEQSGTAAGLPDRETEMVNVSRSEGRSRVDLNETGSTRSGVGPGREELLE